MTRVPSGVMPRRLIGSAAPAVPGRTVEAAATLRRSSAAEGVEALVNPREAARARAALAAAPAEVKRLVSSLEGQGVAQGLFLRAMAARADRIKDPATVNVLRAFAKSMEGLDAKTLLDRATVLDLNASENTSAFDAQTLWEKRGTVKAPAGRSAADDDGLLQRFTSTCGPTVLQMVLAEADPVVAFAINSEGRASTSSRDGAAQFQRAVLEEFGGLGVPRLESALASRLKNGLGRLVSTGALPGDLRDALLRYTKSQGPLDARAKNALHALREQYDGFPTDAELSQVRTAILPARDAGLGTPEFLAAFDKYVKNVTGTKYRSTEPADGFKRGQAGKHLDAVASALQDGHDVPFGVCEPAHWMLMTNVREGAVGREFLVSDPDGGRTAWVTEKDLVSGVFGDKQFHLSQPRERPYIDCFFLPS